MKFLRERILAALRLQPMTIAELSRGLSANPGYVQQLLAAMRLKHNVRYAGTARNGKFRPHRKWELAA
jgi:predicted ArsR family transcriptional regulator